MSSNFNLSENVEDSVLFTIRGKQFALKLPTMDDLEKMQDLSADISKIDAAKQPKEYKKASAKVQDFMYGLISPIGHQDSIKDTLAHENIKVLQNFNTMIETVLSQ